MQTRTGARAVYSDKNLLVTKDSDLKALKRISQFPPESLSMGDRNVLHRTVDRLEIEAAIAVLMRRADHPVLNDYINARRRLVAWMRDNPPPYADPRLRSDAIAPA